MTNLRDTYYYAQPYDLEASGFYFESYEEFQKLYNKNLPVEEYEIQFIDGSNLAYELAQFMGLYQSNIKEYFQLLEKLEEEFGTDVNQVIASIQVLGELGVTECTYEKISNAYDAVIYVTTSALLESEAFEEYAEDSTDLSEVPEYLKPYIDFVAMGRDLAFDHEITEVNGTHYIFTSDVA